MIHIMLCCASGMSTSLLVEKMKKALEVSDKAEDPTVGAGMGMEQLMEKLLQQDTEAREKVQAEFAEAKARKEEDKI